MKFCLIMLCAGAAAAAGLTGVQEAPLPGIRRHDPVQIARWKKRIIGIKKSGKLPIIDRQATYTEGFDIPEMKKAMDELGIALVAFAPKFTDPARGSEESLELSRRDPDYFVPTTADGSTRYWYDQKSPFMEVVEKEVGSGRYWQMGEYELKKYMSAAQAKHHRTDREGFMPLNSPRVQELFRLSSDAQIAFQIHLEPDDELLGSLEEVLGRYPRASVIWCHLGNKKYPKKETIFSPAYADRLLSRYRNLYFDLAVALPGQIYPVNGVFTNVLQDRKGTLLEEWRVILEKHPTRFVVGSDLSRNSWTDYGKIINNQKRILASLSISTAEKIAYKNAWYLITGTEWLDSQS
ncbi:MAG: hypothetical protein NTY77_11370 [Elusimicrobia bacterium]|nr:hypothetical protein [Elusimicrobiota bacterium]